MKRKLMKNIFKQAPCGVLATLIFIAAINAMDTPQTPEDRLQQLAVIKKAVLGTPALRKKIFKRSCDEIYGNKGESAGFCFTPDGTHFIEARRNNVANLVITNMQTGK